MKNHIRITALAGALLALPALGSAVSEGTGALDDFQREGKNRPAKDALEGVAPPALTVEGWLNTGGEPLEWESLRGKVVVLDFWGTW